MVCLCLRSLFCLLFGLICCSHHSLYDPRTDTSYDIKNANLLERLEGVPKEKRTARFVCAVAAVFPDGSEKVVRGTIEGYIGDEPQGENGFGYDPIFYVDAYGCSTAAMSREQKNAISHRGNALRKMKEELVKYENISR